jgi:hypothetical protein
MNIFDLDRAMIEEYAAFSRSFTKIRAQDIRKAVAAALARSPPYRCRTAAVNREDARMILPKEC